ncbi:YqhR family membrane protein [Bacillus sp. DX1.1]|uniref:YqhR family membrane protein n=1 Tax=unclassified Bacillus (in: firmicutes) TaxID=185979 RepID=UPI002570D0CF|nr:MULTISPECIES: YqhR family membrane protein [unclassified Bacillus (in: firmicutes)]MDM5156400.1 YqhR family membrane protein [Bacillus sp. DX1.1]WJE80671.1 YqhR family membrane protein [Bacillus sp. DX3.1]
MTQEQSITKKIVQIGLFGGLFWGGVWYFLHIFSFTEAGPNYLLLPFAFGTWKEGVWGNVLAIVFIGILSIIVAFLYKATFKKFEGVLPGILYGFFWWAILFLGIGSIAPVIKSALQLSKETIVTTICIFILYGVFISYSVAFEANNVNQGEGTEKTNYSNK